MHIVNLGTAGILLALTVLAGCYAQIEDTDVAYVQSDVCGTPSTCLGNNTALTLASDFVPKITVNLGDSGLLTSSQSKQGPLTFNGSLILNQAILTMTTPTAGNFNGIRSIDLRAALGNDTCAALSANCKSIATYDSTRDGTANQMLVVKGSGVNLLDLTDAHQLTIFARGTGNAPSVPSWNGNLDLNMSIKARGSFP